jgi:hypothetical protein
MANTSHTNHLARHVAERRPAASERRRARGLGSPARPSSVLVAQLAERWLVRPVAAGSTPAEHATHTAGFRVRSMQETKRRPTVGRGRGAFSSEAARG